MPDECVIPLHHPPVFLYSSSSTFPTAVATGMMTGVVRRALVAVAALLIALLIDLFFFPFFVYSRN